MAHQLFSVLLLIFQSCSSVVLSASQNVNPYQSPIRVDSSRDHVKALRAEPTHKLDCLPDAVKTSPDATEEKEAADNAKCLEWGCLGTVPLCYFPAEWGYKLQGSAAPSEGTLLSAELTPTTTHEQKYSTPLTVKFDAVRQSESVVQLKFTDDDDATRYEIPSAIVPLAAPTDDGGDALYSVSLEDNALPDHPFVLALNRIDGGQEIFSTDGLPGFTFEDQFIELSLKFLSGDIYGFGEHEHVSFKHSWDNVYLPMFARPHGVGGPNENNEYPNLYGTHPFFMGFDASGKSYGMLFWNSNAQEVYLQPGNIMTYRTTGGVLDLRVFMGPTPGDVVKQYHSMIGKPYFPPYWSLGFQLSKYWYSTLADDTAKLDNVKALYDRMTASGIPWDVQHFDIDYMDRQRAFTTDPVNFVGIKDFIQTLHDAGMRAVTILDPAISANETDWSGTGTGDANYSAWTDGVAEDVYIKIDGTDGLDIAYIKVWPDWPNATQAECHFAGVEWDYQIANCRAYSALPDFFKKSATDWWVAQVDGLRKGTLPGFKTASDSGKIGDYEAVEFDGIWIDMNEPENFITGTLNHAGALYGCPNTTYDRPPYVPHLANRDLGIAAKTMCMSADMTWDQTDGEGPTSYKMYDVKTLYGHSMAVPTLKAANAAIGGRSMVFSRSTFPGTGALIGHWLGDNASTWTSMKRSIIGMLEMNIFGITYTGADICGFFALYEDGVAQQVEEELCYRWMQLGAFYTFSRNHSTKYKPEQDPANFGAEFAAASKRALEMRYRLLPYLYTLMYDSNQNGGTVIRSLMEEFHEDPNTRDIDTQFMWGDGLLFSPILDKGASTRDAYLPDGWWYDIHTGNRIETTGQTMSMASPLQGYSGDIPLHIRGGTILPLQAPSTTTTASRLNPMQLIVAPSASNNASGNLYWDDGSCDISECQHLRSSYTFANGILSSVVVNSGFASDLKFDTIIMLGTEYKSMSTGSTNIAAVPLGDQSVAFAVDHPITGEFSFVFSDETSTTSTTTTTTSASVEASWLNVVTFCVMLGLFNCYMSQ